ncbi:MAG: DUF6128 domain-containing protein [Clostridium sp.]|nr:DUF6128 domain-containing protein [Clostridium sp.]
MEYKRFISYLYAYVDGQKGVNVGYIRCEQRQGICRLTMNLQDHQGIDGGRYKVYLYRVEEGRPIGYYLDELVVHNGCGELRKQTNTENVWNTSHRLGDYDGIIAIYDPAHAYASQWTDEPIRILQFQTSTDWSRMQQERQQELHAAEMPSAPEVWEAENPSQPEPQTDEPADTAPQQAEVSANAEEQQADTRVCISDMTLRLMEQRVKLPDFENHEIYDCVRIEPKDIGLLDMDNWRLGVNSFLTHGYYNYKYLMLGKLRFQDGVIKAVLGVPGVYDNKEQYIAKIFGFDLFVPLKHTNVKTGNFGYWIVELT